MPKFNIFLNKLMKYPRTGLCQLIYSIKVKNKIEWIRMNHIILEIMLSAEIYYKNSKDKIKLWKKWESKFKSEINKLKIFQINCT